MLPVTNPFLTPGNAWAVDPSRAHPAPLPAFAQVMAEAGDNRFGEVPDSREFRRILALPRRSLEAGEALAEEITRAFRTPWGTMRLRPNQALALAEVNRVGGCLLPLLPGEGKTLVSLLAADFCGAKRPLLIVPASLVEKTKKEFRELAKHWQCIHPDRITIISYETLSRANASARLDSQGRVVRPGLLETLRPDLIIFDEVHKVKNKKAAVTRKVKRFLKEHPGIRVVAMSGTLTKRSLRDYAHIAEWALRDKSPIPTTDLDLEAWAACLDEKVASFQRVKPGAFRELDPNIDRDDLSDENLQLCRQAFQKRFIETPGVVSSRGGRLDTALQLHPWDASPDPAIDQAFETLRTKWETPWGEDFADALTLARHARSLALGLCYRWNPPPADEWRNARKAWNTACREILKTNRRQLDSELQVIRAVTLGLYPEALEPLTEWRKIKSTYDPEKHKEAVWISTSAIARAKDWLKGTPSEGPRVGILWTEHTAFAQALAQATGLRYYGRQGQDSKGRAIEDHPANESLIASIQSNGTGRNLQKWSKNLFMSCPPNGMQMEQLIARTHRPGQEADEVECFVYVSCAEQIAGMYQARKDCLYVQDTKGMDQRLCYADWALPEVDEVATRGGWRWVK